LLLVISLLWWVLFDILWGIGVLIMIIFDVFIVFGLSFSLHLLVYFLLKTDVLLLFSSFLLLFLTTGLLHLYAQLLLVLQLFSCLALGLLRVSDEEAPAVGSVA
jgi:hypothetical protein